MRTSRRKPPPEPRRAGEHQHAEQVELPADRHQGPGDREDEDADQVDDHEQRSRGRDGHGRRLSAPEPRTVGARRRDGRAARRRWRRLGRTGEPPLSRSPAPMAHLTLAGLSEDGKRLLLVERRRASSHPRRRRTVSAPRSAASTHALGQLEITMDSTLRPRDIQARIRAGETAEAVAQAAQTTRRARSCRSPRRCSPSAPTSPSAPSAPPYAGAVRRAPAARTLGDAVAAQLRALDVDPTTVEWDSWRREDGRWTLTGAFSGPGRGHGDVRLRRARQLRDPRGRRRPLAGRRAGRPARPPPSGRAAPRAATTSRRPASAGCPRSRRTSCRWARTPSSWSTTTSRPTPSPPWT